MVKFKDFSRPLSVFQVLFKASLMFCFILTINVVNHLKQINLGRRPHEEHLCEIILNLDQQLRKCFKILLF